MSNTFKRLAIATLLGLGVTAGAATLPIPPGPVIFKAIATAQALDMQLMGTKTNHTSSSTNIIQSFKSTVTNSVINNAVLLDLLRNSYNTNLPVDAKLFSTGLGFSVRDATGTTVLLDVSAVMEVEVYNGVKSGPQSHTTTYDVLGITPGVPENTLSTLDVVMIYSDASRSTADATHTTFMMRGPMLLKRTLKNDELRATFLINGSGSGTIRGKTWLLKGTISGKGTDWPIFE